MKRKTALTALVAASTDNPPAGLRSQTFIDEIEALKRVPVSRRTWYEWRKIGLPYIRVRGRILYHWDSVQNWLLRQQRE
jgi:hypothetical protein